MPDESRRWFQRPTRLLALVLVVFVIAVFAGTAYAPKSGVFRMFLPNGDNSNTVTEFFDWWNSVAASAIGGVPHEGGGMRTQAR
jgi:hypothetical protein